MDRMRVMCAALQAEDALDIVEAAMVQSEVCVLKAASAPDHARSVSNGDETAENCPYVDCAPRRDGKIPPLTPSNGSITTTRAPRPQSLLPTSTVP